MSVRVERRSRKEALLRLKRMMVILIDASNSVVLRAGVIGTQLDDGLVVVQAHEVYYKLRR